MIEMQAPPTTDREASTADLVRMARGGDRRAFDRLAAHYRAAVLALAFTRTGDHDAAEDLAQEVLLLAWRHLPTLQDPGAFPVWLRRTAANACASWVRRRPWPASLDEDEGARQVADPAPTPLAAAVAKAEARELRQALYALPDANRYALLMHVWGDYTCQEIAAFLEVPDSTVEGRIQRARTQLRRILGRRAGETLGERPPRWQEET